jgi:hypothetical protein
MRKKTLRDLKARRLTALAFNAGIEITRDIAVHEAGHAVVAEFVGRRVRRVSVGFTARHIGGVTECVAKIYLNHELPNAFAVCCAGMVAGMLFSKQTCEQIEEGSQGDMEEIRRLLDQAIALAAEAGWIGAPPTTEQFLPHAVKIGAAKAREILETECAKKAVNYLADCLLTERSISGDRVREIIGRSSGEKAA